MSDEEKNASDAETSSSEDEGPSEPVVTVAVGRSRRANAGSKMAALLEQAEHDDFYQNTYGGFDEAAEEEDPDFMDKPEEEDIFDSDFGEPEDEFDDVESAEGGQSPRGVDDDDDEAVKKRKKAKQVAAIVKPTKKGPAKPRVPKPLTPSREDKLRGKALATPVTRVFGSPRMRAKRQSTAVKSAEIKERVREREKRRRRQVETFMIKQKLLAGTCRPMTQQEMLEEAKRTEEVNLKSLERHERLEEDKKKTVMRKGLKGRFIRIHSTRMPLIQDVDLECQPVEKADVIAVEGVEQREQDESQRHKPESSSQQYHSRTFVTFPDLLSFDDYFPEVDQTEKRLERSLRRILCPVTAKPARYRDPVTKVPYHDSFAFRVIREAYAMALERHGSKKNHSVADWLRWRQEHVKQRREESLQDVQKVIDEKPRVISNGSITATLAVDEDEDGDSGVVA